MWLGFLYFLLFNKPFHLLTTEGNITVKAKEKYVSEKEGGLNTLF